MGVTIRSGGMDMTREEARQRATELVNRMTVEEIAGQLKYDAEAIERLDIPEYNWWNEGLHGVARAGVATMFPQAIGMAASFDDELLLEEGKVIATEGRAKYNEYSKHEDRDIYKGLTYWSPNINIFRDPRWGRGHETYGEDPYLTGSLGVSFIHGLQGDDDDVPYLKLAACAKHFAVHSGPESMRHFFDAKANSKDLYETYLPAFERAVREAKVESVMGAYNRTNGEPCCANRELMVNILRGKWGFEGHFVSDCWAIRDFHEEHKVTRSAEESAALALNTGCDLNCGCTYQKILDAYRSGRVSLDTLKESAVRLFTTRFLLGMFEHTPYDDIPYEVVECREHLAVAERAARESIVLLKNNGLLPLDKKQYHTIGVIGPNANSRRALIGNYYGTSSRYITVLEGIQDYVGDDVRVLYSEGSHLFLEKGDPLSKMHHRLSEAATVCEHSEVVVLCLGLDETLEGEQGDTGNSDASGDKRNLLLPLCQRKLLEVVIKSGKPYILCMMAGSAIDMTEADQSAAAILQLWYPGARGGKTVADILFGEISPSGKLPVTLYHDTDELPEFTDYSMKNRTYRYFTGTPLYPFGYGLTYGSAKVVSAKVTSGETLAEAARDGAEVTVTLCNDSTVTVEEVVQIYAHMNGTMNEVPNHRLCAYQRVLLPAGETVTVTIPIRASEFTVVDEEGNRRTDGDSVTLFVGFGQPDGRTEELTGQRSVQLHVQ